MAEKADTMLSEVIRGERRTRPVDDMKRYVWGLTPVAVAGWITSPTASSRVGQPHGARMTIWRDGEEAVARVRLGHAFEGAPGRAMAASWPSIFDDVMGIVLTIHSTPAFTARLTVSYLKPYRWGRARVPARQTWTEGRKLFIASEAFHGDETVAEAEGLFIALPPERFGLAPAPEEIRAQSDDLI